ncbi:MAG: ribosomal-processing cysteine protease Prp [Treponema sp.]|jgi:uncharacterized protein YsxB (DUF464 family)|nr:ribosomal-processing cysteine protease Prp [Treponema sp.]
MINIEIVLDNDLLKYCRIKGHAYAGSKGKDVVCAAVSVLARTALEVLAGQDGISLHYEAKKPGEFFLEIVGYNETEKAFLFSVGTFLMVGFDSITREYPKHCWLSVNTNV